MGFEEPPGTPVLCWARCTEGKHCACAKARELCANSTLWREGRWTRCDGWQGGNPTAFPSPAPSASGAQFPLSNLFFLSLQPLCASTRLCWGVLSAVGDKDTSELPRTRGRAVRPCVGAGGGRGSRMLWVPAAAHKNNVNPSAADWGRKLPRCSSSAAVSGPGGVGLGAGGCWGHGAGADALGGSSSCHGVPTQEWPWELWSSSVTPNSPTCPAQAAESQGKLQAAVTSGALAATGLPAKGCSVLRGPGGLRCPWEAPGTQGCPGQELPPAFPADGFRFPPSCPFLPARGFSAVLPGKGWWALPPECQPGE